MDPVQVISLRRSQPRRVEFARNNPGLHFEFFDAVDGSGLSPSSIAQSGLFLPGLPYSGGAVGCALSHLRLWEQAIDAGRPLTIAEDDTVFRRDFVPARDAALAALGPDWDLVMWGWNFDSILSIRALPGVSPAVLLFSQDELRRSMDRFVSMTDPPHLWRLERCFGTPCYTISPQGARRLRELCFPLAPFSLYFPVLDRQLPNNGIDIAMNRIYAATRSHVAFPPLVATPNDRAASTVQQVARAP